VMAGDPQVSPERYMEGLRSGLATSSWERTGWLEQETMAWQVHEGPGLCRLL
jgi:hypothetical protein